jgi:glycolate oxidase iron-sulfur subunit
MFPDDDVLREANKCSGCGFCLSACPVYQALGVETLASRGRVDAVRGLLKGDLKLTPRIQEILSSCLMCKACETACPPGVVSHKLILEGRRRAIERKGLPLTKRLAFRRLLKDRKALRRALRAASMVQNMGPPVGKGQLRHLPTLFSGLAGGRGLPPLARNPLRDRIAELTPPAASVEPQGRVTLFSGCYLDFVDTPLGHSAVRILTGWGYEVAFPKAQVCCGAPVLYSGDVADAADLASRNGRALEGDPAVPVVTLCATCGSTLKEGYQSLAAHLQGEDRLRVESLTQRVTDLSQFLLSSASTKELSLPEPMTVTYHDPCHHVRAMGVGREPRELLRSIGGVRFVEMAEPTRCCGGGGSFSLTHPDISVEVGRWKVRDILQTGAQAVVTSCPGCILQIQEVAQREGANFRVLHLVELLERSRPQ